MTAPAAPVPAPTIAENWQDFVRSELADPTPAQLDILQVAFMAGASTGMAMVLHASEQQRLRPSVQRMAAEITAFCAIRRMKRNRENA